MVVIAITREIGSRSEKIASGVAESLSLSIINHDLLALQISGNTGIDDVLINRFLEGRLSHWEWWKLNSKLLKAHTECQIYQLATKDNVLIRGWGAAQLLAEIPGVLCVRVCAPVSDRLVELVERHNAAAIEAEHLICDGHEERCPALIRAGIRVDASQVLRDIRRSDAAHSALNIDQVDAPNYDLVLNTARLSVPDCISEIVCLAQSTRFKRPNASKVWLGDRLNELRARLNNSSTKKRPDRRVVDQPDEGWERTSATSASSDNFCVANRPTGPTGEALSPTRSNGG